LNEILDAKSDAMHPLKKHRAVPSGKIKVSVAYAESAILVICGLMVAYSLNMRVLLVSLILCVMALVYNVRPIRAKDQPYVDVLSESVNNPLRLAIGWYCTGIDVLPPASLVAAYWMVGAFFMAVKRFAEYRRINDPERAIMYRQSFKHYNEQRLLVSITYYGVAFGLFFGIFLTRYKMELILSIPLIAGFIAWYIHLGFLPDSPTQSPERLFKRKWFTAYACLCIVVMCGLLFSDIPVVEKTFVPTIPTQSLLPAQK
jgi:4-hydroxybenzoate polyprenyltransferase